jgi:glycosyltransferase involved in cell wall biosynthesis
MKSQKTILFITPYFPPQGGGLEIYAQQIAKELCKDPHKRIVVVTSGEQNGIDRIQKVDNLKVYRLSYRFKLSNSPFSLSWISKIRRILKVERPDLVNIHTPVPGIGDLVAMLSPRIPLVVTYHTGSMKKENILFDIPIWTYEHIWLPILLRHARYIICPSDFVRLDFLGKYMSKSTTISPGIDNSIFKPDITKKSPHPTIVFVAAFLTKATKFKGLHTVIKSFSTLITEFPTLKLIVVGDGDMRSNYESEIRRLGIQSSVSFLGSLNQEELIEVYQKAHIFALPSKLESFGSSILEAMSCGMPVVSTRVGGIPSLVDDGQTGYLIKPDHPSILTEKIRYLLVNPQISKNFGLAARKKAVSSYSWKISAAKYDQIIDSILYIKPTIAQIVAYYPPHIGGMEIVAQQISHELANQGYPVKVLTSNIGSQNYPDIEISPNLVIKRLILAIIMAISGSPA